MTPEQKEDYEVAEIAAEIARQIQEMADRDQVEYGAIIYRAPDGTITHTPITRGNATSVPDMSTEGMPGWASALGVVHSHPAILFDPNRENFRLHPTPYGDWASFNGTQELIVRDLVDNGYSEHAARTRANELVTFVYGAAGPVGTGEYRLLRYDDSDEDNQATSSENQIANAEEVSMTLGTCQQ